MSRFKCLHVGYAYLCTAAFFFAASDVSAIAVEGEIVAKRMASYEGFFPAPLTIEFDASRGETVEVINVSPLLVAEDKYFLYSRSGRFENPTLGPAETVRGVVQTSTPEYTIGFGQGTPDQGNVSPAGFLTRLNVDAPWVGQGFFGEEAYSYPLQRPWNETFGVYGSLSGIGSFTHHYGDVFGGSADPVENLHDGAIRVRLVRIPTTSRLLNGVFEVDLTYELFTEHRIKDSRMAGSAMAYQEMGDAVKTITGSIRRVETATALANLSLAAKRYAQSPATFVLSPDELIDAVGLMKSNELTDQIHFETTIRDLPEYENEMNRVVEELILRLADDTADYITSPATKYADVVDAAWEDSVDGIVRDPPRYDYGVAHTPSHYHLPMAARARLGASRADLFEASVELSRVGPALLAAVERFQGAKIDGNVAAAANQETIALALEARADLASQEYLAAASAVRDDLLAGASLSLEEVDTILGLDFSDYAAVLHIARYQHFTDTGEYLDADETIAPYEEFFASVSRDELLNPHLMFLPVPPQGLYETRDRYIALQRGDYDSNGVVDNRDYLIWRSQFGQLGNDSSADGNLDGVVDAADYSIWRDHFGQEFADFQASSNSQSGVTLPAPEPLTLSMLLTGLPGSLIARRRWRRINSCGI